MCVLFLQFGYDVLFHNLQFCGPLGVVLRLLGRPVSYAVLEFLDLSLKLCELVRVLVRFCCGLLFVVRLLLCAVPPPCSVVEFGDWSDFAVPFAHVGLAEGCDEA